MGNSDLQPEVELGGDHSPFTRTTNPHNPWCVNKILKQVSIGAHLSDEQQNRVHNLLSEFADCFTLSVSEVIAIPGTEHCIHIPADATFPRKIPCQWQLTEAQCAYLSDAIDKLLKVDIIKPIQPEDIKCVSPITLAQKVHINQGLSPDELRLGFRTGIPRVGISHTIPMVGIYQYRPVKHMVPYETRGNTITHGISNIKIIKNSITITL